MYMKISENNGIAAELDPHENREIKENAYTESGTLCARFKIVWGPILLRDTNIGKN